MTLRKFTPEFEVVFDLVVEQRQESDRDDDYIIYSIRRGQRTLRTGKKAGEYGIGPVQQLEIIQKLAKDKIIDADWIVKRVGPDEQEFKFNHHDKKYMWDRYGTSLALFDESDCKDSCFIQISFDDIKHINDTYKAKYLCTLAYDDIKKRFVIECDNGKKLVINNAKLKDGFPPAEVLKAALRSPDNYIERDDFDKNNGKRGGFKIGKKSIATGIFDDSSVIRNELAPFIKKMTSNSLHVQPTVMLSLAELNYIEEICI